MAAADAPGNIVVIDIGQGRYVSYAHLKPGTLEVAPGDRVVEGQRLARIGNSGNTLGPHLHFQVADAAEPLSGEGLPFSLRSFELTGRVPSIPALLGGAPWRAEPAQPARTVTDETPLENMVMRFGSGPPPAGRPR
jgi:murein DD-endopeptidase MepM/ murein hydrolase activator NlpD